LSNNLICRFSNFPVSTVIGDRLSSSSRLKLFPFIENGKSVVSKVVVNDGGVLSPLPPLPEEETDVKNEV